MALNNDTVDIYMRAAFTMERDLHEPSTSTGFAFSTPFYYGGLVFAGLPEGVACADALQTWGDDCSDLMVCVGEGTTHQSIIESVLPRSRILPLPIASILPALAQGQCNAVFGQSFSITKVLIVEEALGPGYVVGSRVLHYEAMAMVTRDDDPHWSSLVNSILQALMVAEEEELNNETASILGDSIMMFGRAVAATGTYADIYERNYEGAIPRHGHGAINTINTYNLDPRTSGLLRANELGAVSTLGSGPTPGGTLERIRQRGFLTCGGLGQQIGFVERDETRTRWSGMDVDFCHALSVGLFLGRIEVRFVELDSQEIGITSLNNATLDVVAGLSVDRMSASLASFSQPYYYDNSR